VLELYREGLDAFRRGDQNASRACNEQALALAVELGDPAGRALALVGLSRVALREGEYDRVRDLARDARELAQATGDRSTEVAPLHLQAAGTRLAGEYDVARDLYLESLELNRELRDERMVTVELHNLAHVELHRDDVAAAERLFAERLESRDPSDPYDRAMDALDDAALSVARGEGKEVEELLHEAEAILDAEGIVLDPDDRFELEWTRGRARA
jgi:tetratricopeptide (TPR) repeat protein